MKRRWTKLLSVIVVTAGLLTGCGGASGSSKSMMADTAAPVEKNISSEYYGNGVANDNYAATDEEIAMEESGSVTAGQVKEETPEPDGMKLLEEKLVYHCDLEIETLDYPATMVSIREAISRYGGIIQSENESDSGANWYYENYHKTSGTMHNYLAVRIPSKEYNNFLAELGGVGKVISKYTSVDNISQQYYDTTTQIEALKIQEKNLLSMLEKCETIEDMITVEQRLSEVQYDLNSLQTVRRYMDMDVAYSYVNIGISEVMEYRQDSEPVRRNTFVDRLKNTLVSTGRGFVSFLEALLFLVIRLSPYIVIIAVICFVFFRKKIRSFAETWKNRKRINSDLQSRASQNKMAPPAMPQETNWQIPPAGPQETNWQTSPAGLQETNWQTPPAGSQETNWQTSPAGQMSQGVQSPVQETPQTLPASSEKSQNGEDSRQ